MTEVLLALNVGSSSIKFALYARERLAPLCRGHVEGIGTPVQSATWSGALAMKLEGVRPTPGADHRQAIVWLLRALRERLPEATLVAVGHRVVHGGAVFAKPVPIDASVIEQLEQFVPLAPNHQPHSLAAIRAVATAWPQLPQIACFDTAFHRTQPRLAQLFALPRALTDQGILRYGFHGLSYAYLADELPRYAGARADGRVVIAHLGHGASLCALHARQSIATTMGFSAVDGLMMGTRSGAIDPGVLLYLLQARQYDAARLADLLYNRCGLLGVSGLSDDLRTLEASSDAHAAEAIDLFAYRAARELGSMAAALGGLDVLVFTAGIGERSAAMRARICAYARWLGVDLDAKANAEQRNKISSAASPVDVFVIPTDEEIVIARATHALLSHATADTTASA
jgi:acetate kinase